MILLTIFGIINIKLLSKQRLERMVFMQIGIETNQVRERAEMFRATGNERYNESLAPSFEDISTLINDVAQGLIANANFYEEADNDAAKANNRN